MSFDEGGEEARKVLNVSMLTQISVSRWMDGLNSTFVDPIVISVSHIHRCATNSAK